MPKTVLRLEGALASCARLERFRLWCTEVVQTHITIDPSELEAVFRKSNNRNTLLAIEAGGSNHTCLVKEVQRHPLTQKIVHLDLFEVDAAEDVRVEVNIVPVGTAWV